MSLPILLQTLFTTDVWWSYLLRIGGYLLIAWFVQRLANRLAGRLLQLNRFTPARFRLRPERMDTLRTLFAGIITLLAFATAVLLSLSLFVGGDTLVWMVGLFSAAFGLGARPVISDYLTGVSFLFEDPFDVGEKVEIMGVEGIVEQVYLRSTLLRAPTGESYFVPNGEIRVIRNFSRGLFSMANITFKVAATNLPRTLTLLEEVGDEAVQLLPNLLEHWQVISETGTLGAQTQLTLVTKTRYGKAAELRPRLLALLQDRLGQVGIELKD